MHNSTQIYRAPAYTPISSSGKKNEIAHTDKSSIVFNGNKPQNSLKQVSQKKEVLQKQQNQTASLWQRATDWWYGVDREKEKHLARVRNAFDKPSPKALQRQGRGLHQNTLSVEISATQTSSTPFFGAVKVCGDGNEALLYAEIFTKQRIVEIYTLQNNILQKNVTASNALSAQMPALAQFTSKGIVCSGNRYNLFSTYLIPLSNASLFHSVIDNQTFLQLDYEAFKNQTRQLLSFPAAIRTTGQAVTIAIYNSTSVAYLSQTDPLQFAAASIQRLRSAITDSQILSLADGSIRVFLFSSGSNENVALNGTIPGRLIVVDQPVFFMQRTPAAIEKILFLSRNILTNELALQIFDSTTNQAIQSTILETELTTGSSPTIVYCGPAYPDIYFYARESYYDIQNANIKYDFVNIRDNCTSIIGGEKTFTFGPQSPEFGKQPAPQAALIGEGTIGVWYQNENSALCMMTIKLVPAQSPSTILYSPSVTISPSPTPIIPSPSPIIPPSPIASSPSPSPIIPPSQAPIIPSPSPLTPPSPIASTPSPSPIIPPSQAPIIPSPSPLTPPSPIASTPSPSPIIPPSQAPIIPSPIASIPSPSPIIPPSQTSTLTPTPTPIPLPTSALASSSTPSSRSPSPIISPLPTPQPTPIPTPIPLPSPTSPLAPLPIPSSPLSSQQLPSPASGIQTSPPAFVPPSPSIVTLSPSLTSPAAQVPSVSTPPIFIPSIEDFIPSPIPSPYVNSGIVDKPQQPLPIIAIIVVPVGIVLVISVIGIIILKKKKKACFAEKLNKTDINWQDSPSPSKDRRSEEELSEASSSSAAAIPIGTANSATKNDFSSNSSTQDMDAEEPAYNTKTFVPPKNEALTDKEKKDFDNAETYGGV